MVDDERKPEKLATINQYLHAQFPNLEIRHHNNFDDMAEVFTVVRGPASNFFRFVVSEDYVNDHTERELADALKNHDIAQRLEANESRDVFLDNSGLAIVERG